MAEGSLDERATTIGEDRYEHTCHPTPSPVSSLLLFFSCIFLICLIFPFLLLVSSRFAFQIEEETDFSLDLSFLDQTTPAPSP